MSEITVTKREKTMLDATGMKIEQEYSDGSSGSILLGISWGNRVCVNIFGDDRVPTLSLDELKQFVVLCETHVANNPVEAAQS